MRNWLSWKENHRLKLEREVLKKAAVFFAIESGSGISPKYREENVSNNVSDDDRVANELALQEGDRLFSAYERLPKILVMNGIDPSLQCCFQKNIE